MDFLWIAAAGMIGGSGLLAAVYGANKLGYADAQPISVISSFFTGKRSKSPGIQLFLLGAVGFALLYFVILSMFANSPGMIQFIIGGCIGFAQGMIATLSSVYVFADLHPLEEYKEMPFPVLLEYVFGHMVFGFGVGAVYAFSNVNLEVLKTFPL